MNAYYQWLNALVNETKKSFSAWHEIRWLNAYSSDDVQHQRDSLLEKFGNSILFGETKPFHHQISKGCEICGKGKWSCLFITNKCNANCFYCPAPQHSDETPSTQSFDFETPDDYAHYVRHFDFDGVSFSGGEPLLYFDRTLDYLRSVRRICKPELYTWMYTNGFLADFEKMKLLADEGLDEIRFDVGASGFDLRHIKAASGIIPNITIEIPAVPEEKDKLIRLLPEMEKLGVSNLNLHQMRLTPHNAKHLIKRGYTIIAAEKPLVLESELTALEIAAYAKEHGLDIGVNYCSFFFKHRYQQAGFRKRLAAIIASQNEHITQNGYLRESGTDSIAYKTIRLYRDPSVKKELKRVEINGRAYHYSEEYVFKKENLSRDQHEMISNMIQHEPGEIPADPLLFRVWQFEYLEKGLREY